MRRYFYFLSLFLLLLCKNSVYCQVGAGLTSISSRLIAASPEASTIAMYQNYPVDYVTGAPQINIPLFSIKTGLGDIPFSLNYHIGKVKPAELSGIVGTGWSLSPDLGITRSVHGSIDGVNKGYPANSNLGDTSGFYHYQAATGVLDEQPDDFFYSLLDKSGGFIYSHSGYFVTMPYEALTFSHTDDYGFVLTDDDGTRYYFGKYANNTDTLAEYAGTNETDSTLNLSAWKIAEIISKDNDTIHFAYSKQKKIEMVPFLNNQWKITEYPNNSNNEPQVLGLPGGSTPQGGYGVLRPNYSHTGSFDVTSFDFPSAQTPPPATNDYKVSMTATTPDQADGKHKYMWQQLGNLGQDSAASLYTNNFVFETLLTTITFRGGRIEFSYSGDRQLTDLRVYAGNMLIKKVRFVQHQFTDGNFNDKPASIPSSYYNLYCKRFFLDSVVITGSDSLQPGLRYGIAYAPGSFGIYNNYNTDYWGYWKSSGTAVPHLVYLLDHYKSYTGDYSDTISTHIGLSENVATWMEIGSYQEQISPSGTMGTISRITYPTGGSAAFEFEQNRYESPAQAGRIVYGGGYRIKSIRYVTGQGQDSLVKTYTYGTTAENGYGLTKYQNYGENFMFQQWVSTINPYDINNVLLKNTYINSRPFLDNSFSMGAVVLYPTVTEYSISPKNNLPSGKTVYSYNINSTEVNWEWMTPVATDSRNDWNAIVPESIMQYGYSSGNYYPVESKIFTYTTFSKETVPAAQTYLRYYDLYPLNDIDKYSNFDYYDVARYAHLNYSILTGANKLTGEKDTLFNQPSPSGYIATQSMYSYDPAYLYKIGATTKDSRGFTKVTHYWYPFQSSVPGYSAAQQNYLTSLSGSRRIASPVEIIDSVNGSIMHTNRQEFLPGSILLPGNLYSAARTNSAVPVKQVLSYDNYGNIREQQQIDSTRETYLWGYNSLYPVAKVIGSSYTSASGLVNQSTLDNPSTSDNDMRNELNKLRTGLPNAQVWTYTYKPGIGMTSETDPQGNTTYYNYDSLGRLIEARDKDGHLLETHKYHYINQ